MSTPESFIVGIAGPTCSGKTTLERNLTQSLGNSVSILPFDDMSIAGEPEDVGATSWEHPDCYRWPEYRQHLRDLREGRPTTVEANFWESRNEGIYRRRVEPREIIVSVGFLALYDAIARKEFDLKLYIDLPDDELIARRVKRQQYLDPTADPMPYILDHILPANRLYVEPQRRYAHAVIDGRHTRSQIHDKVLELIRGRPSCVV